MMNALGITGNGGAMEAGKTASKEAKKQPKNQLKKRPKKQASGTIFDDVFRTIAQKMPELMVALINAVYGTDYERSEARQLRNEFIEGDGKIITDSIFEIRDRIFHIECQSNADSTMVIRMFEYDVSIAKERAQKEGGVYTIRFPESLVLYLRHGKSKPEKSKAVVEFPNGKTASYEVCNIYADDYSVEQIFAQKLFVLLPYYLIRHESRFDEYETDGNAREELLRECEDIQRRMEECFMRDEDRSSMYQDLMNLILKISNHLLREHKETKKGVNKIMGGKVLELASEISERRGEKRGEKRGERRGEKRGEKRGMARGEKQTAELFGWLVSAGRYDDVKKASFDEEARAKFFSEYHTLKASQVSDQ
ncbi:MAG: hypothetical protein IJ679_13010 [Lachnospiraceae bacterium]|nr:hypothetical protein [Lachnospiraceae bacterium]